MATKNWRGDAPAVAQVTSIVPAGPSQNATFAVTINGKTVTYTASSTDTVASVCTGLQTLLAASTIPEFQEISWTTDSATYILATATTAGKPYTLTTSATGTGATLTSGALATPVNSAFGSASTGGSLSNGTYYYRVSAINAVGETVPSTETNITISGGTSTQTVTVNWGAVAGATGYRVYGRSTGAELFIAQVGAVLTYTDTGSITPAGQMPTVNTTTTANSSPNDWNNAVNWSPSGVPASGDDVKIFNSAVDIFYGLAQAYVTLNSLTIDSSFTATIGLPEYNGSYYEYRTLYLQVGPTTITIGNGPGNGSGRIKIDCGGVLTTMTVNNTSTPTDSGRQAVLWKGTNASNVVNVNKGSVGIASYPGELATVLTLREGYVTNVTGDASLWCGAGTTLTTVNKSGGDITLQSNVTTFTQTAGTCTLLGGMYVVTLQIDGGTVTPKCTGTTALTTPVNSAFSQADSGGSLLNTTTYYYRVSALNAVGETLASTETSQTTSGNGANQHTVTVNWGAVTGATGYRIYGRSTGAELFIAQVGAVTTYTDTGSITPVGPLPTVNTTGAAIGTTNVLGGSTLDFSQDMQAKTVINCNLYVGGTINDPFGVVTWTNGIQMPDANLTGVVLNVGFNRNYKFV